MWNDYLIVNNNHLTIVDTEAAGIGYICKINNVDILVIKGISDFPSNEAETSIQTSYEEQYSQYKRNIPIIMNKILNEYLKEVIK